ncbi:hypothetical protein C2G38_1688361 [Gigaspora rosea]|uniref:Crinkler effector protein N-terminal domain-containing protein n=1 Tax=Gigaspora rosea TaxID=44941 RepID=A0A397V254_9GLOM|nr:hypothetical protein C2G38_1688361 [Gigaspora rosea]
MTGYLSNLKNIIKAAMPPEYSDVHVHHVKLWKVNIRDDQEGELSNITFRDSEILLATRKIRYYFPDDPVDNYIHVIVEATNPLKQEIVDLKHQIKALQRQISSERSSSSNDVQHHTNPIIARNENIKQILSIPPPSIAAQHSTFFTKVNKNELDPIILNHRPHNSLGPPVILFNDIFNQFIIDLENETLPISPKVSNMLNSLIKDMSNHYKSEKDRLKMLFNYFKELLWPLQQVKNEDESAPDGVVTAFSPKFNEISTIILLEVKNEIGTGSSDPTIQGSLSYVRHWAQNNFKNLEA